MKFNKKIPFLFILSLTSCQQELVYNPFELSENGLSRYMSRIEETTYSNSVSSPKETTTILFNNPEYDKYGRLTFVYNNFAGYEANYTYSYSSNEIETTANRKNGEVIRRKYALKDNIIISCLESTNQNDNVKNYYYSYDSSNMLVKIEISDEEYDNSSKIFIEWEKQIFLLSRWI